MRFVHVHTLDPQTTLLLRAAVASLNVTGAKIDLVSQKLDQLIAKGESEQMDLTRISADVKKNTDGIASARAALAGVADQIRQNVADQAALGALADTLEKDDADLAGSIVANTTPAPAATA